jgi:superfamily II DNA or RNA helicase
MTLRPYQEKAVDEIREHYKSGKRKVLLHLPTGAGKTVVFCHIMKKIALAKRPSIMVVRGRKLVDQGSQRLFREDVYHGVLMAKHWNNQPIAPTQVCSIDTLRSRRLRPPAELIVIDEAHYAISDSYKEFLADYPDARILAVTATPYVPVSLRHIADVVVKPTTVKWLIDNGDLVNAKYYAPSTPNLDDVEISKMTGDYKQDQLAEAMSQSGLVGGIVDHWKKLGDNRPTICFAVNVQHSKNIVQQFLGAGISAEHCDDKTTDKERGEILKRLASGETKVVSNVGILCVGVDIPSLGCIIMARPTKSLNLYIQQAGRGTRPFPGKNNFILLDHAGNVLRHGFITDEHEVNLDGSKEKREGAAPKTCPECFAVYESDPCPACGYVKPIEEGSANKREIIELGGELEELYELPVEARVKRDIIIFSNEAKKKGYKKGWVYHKILAKWGEQIANEHFQRRQIPDTVLFARTHGIN